MEPWAFSFKLSGSALGATERACRYVFLTLRVRPIVTRSVTGTKDAH